MNIEELSFGLATDRKIDQKGRIFIPNFIKPSDDHKFAIYQDDDGIIKIFNTNMLELYLKEAYASYKSAGQIDKYIKSIEKKASKIISIENLDSQRRILFSEVLRIKEYNGIVHFQGLGYTTAVYTTQEAQEKKLIKR